MFEIVDSANNEFRSVSTRKNSRNVQVFTFCSLFCQEKRETFFVRKKEQRHF